MRVLSLREREGGRERSSLPEVILALIVAYEARDRLEQIRDKSCNTRSHSADGGFFFLNPD